MRPVLLALALALAPAPALAERLPDDVRPIRYRLHFEPDLAAERFDGAAEIDVTGRPMKSRSFDGFQSQ
jgi:hypothetical protein